MRLLTATVVAACLLGAGATAALAQGEFPLKYVAAKEGDPLVASGGLSSVGMPSKPPEVKAAPKGLSDKARWFAVLRGTRGQVWAALEPSTPPKLWVDAARTGDLSAAEPLTGQEAANRTRFGPVAIKAGEGAGATAVQVYLVAARCNQILGAVPAGYMGGEAKLGGTVLRVAVADRDMDGRITPADLGKQGASWRADQIAIEDPAAAPGSPPMAPRPFTKAARVKDAYYKVRVADDLSSIRFDKYEPKTGTIDVGSPDASLGVRSEAGPLVLSGPGGKWEVPEGTYTWGEQLSISKADASGARWTLSLSSPGPPEKFEVRAGKTTALKVGPPLAPKVEALSLGSGEVLLILVLAGKGGEMYSAGVQKSGTLRSPPKVKVIDASGKVLAEGDAGFS